MLIYVSERLWSYRKKDLSAENIYKTLNEVFKDVDREYDYAVIYYEHKEEKITRLTELFGHPCFQNIVNVHDYGCIDYYKDLYDATCRWRELQQITNKSYHRVAIVSYLDSEIIISEEK